MTSKKKSTAPVITKADLDMIKNSENLLIDKEKRYQRKDLKPQVEQQTQLRESKKPAANKK